MKTLTKHLSQKGTSLIEVILYIALFSIIILVIFDLLLTSGSLKTESESQINLQKNARFITEKITSTVRNAETIALPNTIGQITNNLVTTTALETHDFYLSSENLIYQKTVSGTMSSANLNTNLVKVSNLAVEAVGFLNGKISLKVSFSLTESKASQSGFQAKDYQFIVTQR